MFLVFDYGTRIRYRSDDIDTAADVVLGITGAVSDHTKLLNMLPHMEFDDIFATPKYCIQCVREEDIE